MGLKNKPEPLTEEQRFRMLRSLQLIGLCAEVITIDFQTDFEDMQLRDPNMNRLAKGIKESAEKIKNFLKQGTYIKDQEFYNYTYGTEVWRLLFNLGGLDVGFISNINDELEAAMERGQIQV